jgi:ABC-type anion transport system duplicated permease subunit
MVELVPVEELLVRLTVPLAAPATVGSKLIVRVAVLPAASVSGKVTPESVNSEPLNDPALTVTVAVPEEVRVTVLVAVAATFTVPKLTLVALRVSVGTAAPRLIV